jgi:predicted dehydrogenase
MKMRACLCGVSGFGEVHYNDLLRESQAGRCEIVAATVINAQDEPAKCARLRELGCEIFDDYRAMLAAVGEGADVCWLPVGIALHAPFTVEALRAGMNVFVEKPLAGTIQEARAIRAAEQETGRWVAVGYQDMYQPDTRRMKQAILDGALGEVQIIKCGACWPREQAYFSRNHWAGQLKVDETWVLDSPVNNALAHQLNQMCYLAGETLDGCCRPTSIRAELYHVNSIPSADTASLRIETAEGIPLLFTVTHACREQHDPEIIVRGTGGTMTWNMQHMLRLTRPDGTTQNFPAEDRGRYRENIFDALLARLVDPSARVYTPAQAAAQTLCVNGAHSASPVLPVPEACVVAGLRGELPLRAIENAESLVARSIAEEKCFSDLGVAWARKPAALDLTTFERFEGPAQA